MDDYLEQVLTSTFMDDVGSTVVDSIGPFQSFPRILSSGLDFIGGAEDQGLHSPEHQAAIMNTHQSHLQPRDFSQKYLESDGTEQPLFQQSSRSLSVAESSWQDPGIPGAQPLLASQASLGRFPSEDELSHNLHFEKRVRTKFQAKVPQGSGEQSQSVVNIGTAKPRVRARRGQATDPHSIAERNRRERIAERMKALQELVPDSNKTDKASMLDEIISYVKFLQMQVKCLSMCRLGGSGIAAPLLADLPLEGAANFVAAHLAQANGVATASQDGIALVERQVACLMDEDMSAALQYLQSKGLCLMPISLATAISSTGPNEQAASTKSSNANGDENQVMELDRIAAKSGPVLGINPVALSSLCKETCQDDGMNGNLTHGTIHLQSSSIGAATKDCEEG